MALKTNSKKFRENLRKYIIDNFNFDEYFINTGIQLEHDFNLVKKVIIDTFNKEKYYSNEYAIKHGIAPAKMFYDWCCGLPLYLICDDFILGDSVETLGNLLEQTDAEKSKYNDMQSMQMIIDLIYRELTK